MNLSLIPHTLKASLPRLIHSCVEVPVILLIRHAERVDAHENLAEECVPITDNGRLTASALGHALRRHIASLHSSPVLRCIQTAEAIQHGARRQLGIHADHQLGAPGAYVSAPKRAGHQWQTLGFTSVMRHLVESRVPLPGMNAPDAAAVALLQHMVATVGLQPGIHIFISHDSIVFPTARWLLGLPVGMGDLPDFLESMSMELCHDTIKLTYRDYSCVSLI